MMEDYKKRFMVSTILTIPLLILSPSIQDWLGISISFPGDYLVLVGLATIIYLYGGKP
ncbi:MAG: heavy metal translocating P-type ATPase, partial [Thermoprotei archaeon]